MGNSNEKISSVELKPIPQTYEALSKEVQLMSILRLAPNADPSPRAQLCHFMTESRKIGRSPIYASILMVGSSGVGKSSTINHLFDTGDGIEFAKTSDSQSETRNTSEFVLTVDEPKFEVSDLQLGIVDTPGFNDTDGLRQDACNFYSIKQFYETHPKLIGCYPNLIFLLVQATDTRIGGRNSDLSKSLRCLQQLSLVDRDHPNVVAVLTFCCSVNYKNDANWKEKMAKKKAIIQRIVFKAVKVRAPVVVLENDYGKDGEQLQVDGDFTRLPNGELQPKNLYNACKEVLKANFDHFGLMAFNACFDKRKKKGQPTTGHKAKAKNASEESLTAEEEEVVKLLQETAKGEKYGPIAYTAQQYTNEKKLIGEQKEEVEDIAFALEGMGLKDNDCTSIPKGSVEYFHGDEISPTGAEMLEKEFQIKKKPVDLDSGDLVGQGYNILTDKPTSVQIMDFETEERDFGFVLPTCAKVEKVNRTQSFLGQYKDEKSYVQSRLAHLNVGLEVQHDVFSMGARAGFNRSESSSGESSNSGYSVLHERRMFKVKIANFKEENGITFTKDFESEVKKLPDEYKKDDPKNRKCFERFFNRFGHFIVTSAFGGGAVEVTVSEQSLKSGDEKKSLEEAKASLPSLFFGVDGESTGGRSSSSTALSKDFLNQSNVRWSGGSPDLHTNDTLTSKEKMLEWKTSLIVKPTLLNTEMTLEPISTVIECIDDGKKEASYDALEDLLGGKFKLLAFKEEEEARVRNESNKRLESVEDPPKSGWWESLWGIAAGVGATTLGVIGCVVVVVAGILKSR